MKVKSSSFVIQKYIEQPLLINNRKFDIRIWVLYYQSKLYVSKDGYIRTACEEFSINDNDITDQYIHLTNNAIQKNAEKYGQYEDGNQMSFQMLEDYVKLTYNQNFTMEQIVSQMKFIIELTFKSIEHQFEVSLTEVL